MLILAILAVVLLAALAVGITAVARVELMASRSALRRMQALFLAEAGLQEARSVLMYDDQNVDTLKDPWGPECEDPLDAPRQYGDGYYRVRVYDACARININTADQETLFRLTGDPMLAAAIIDWRDAGDMPSAEGAEREYYLSLRHPYLPRNGPFQTLGELLLVRGMTPQLLYFSDGSRPPLSDLLTVHSLALNTDANGGTRVNLNSFRNWSEQAFRDYILRKLGNVLTEYDANQIWLAMNGLPGQVYTSVGQLVTAAGLSFDKVAGIVDLVTADNSLLGAGKVNVNTAPIEVLAALPGSSATVAMDIVARRQQAPFTSLGEVAQLLLSEQDGPQVFAGMIDWLTTKSSMFIVESMGYTPEGGVRTIRALVRRDADAVSVVQEVEQDWPMAPLGERYPGSVYVQTASAR